MDAPFLVASAASVRAAIARTILGSQSFAAELGAVRLKPHQASSIPRLELALNEFGGALLCDEVGMGKTYIALAIARRYARVLIVAPAGLKEMWRDAIARSRTQASFTTFERLSRGTVPSLCADLVIIDEAHHVRNPRTRRYAAVARLGRDARIVMLTATPIHNRRADLVALLALFLGSRANNLTERELAHCVVRREHGDADSSAEVPQIDAVIGCDVPDDPILVARLIDLPPPLPPRDGKSGGALLNRGLVHQWSSSDAAVRDAVRRRLAKASALTASLNAGRYPSARELETWTFADDALQLGFAQLLAPPAPDAAALLRSVSDHALALEALVQGYAEASTLDDAKAGTLRRIREENPGAKIVAFAQYASTVSALFRKLARFGGVGALTASGARVAGGRLSRNEAINRFAPYANHTIPPSRAQAIDLLLTTDLLSEGVNLQDAEIVVHLDIPWTAARMEQRVGRVARMGSSYRRVRVFQFRAPASAEAILHEEFLVSKKWALARREVGGKQHGLLVTGRDCPSPAASVALRTERLRATLKRWLETSRDVDRPDGHVLIAAVASDRLGFVAAGYLGEAPLLLCSRDNCVSADLDVQIAACLAAEGHGAEVDHRQRDAVCRVIQQWVEYTEASDFAGAGSTSSGANRRLINRIDATLQNAPPHLRATRARLASAARGVASTSYGAAVEMELRELADAPVRDDRWLETLAALAGPEKRRYSGSTSFRLRALLLLTP